MEKELFFIPVTYRFSLSLSDSTTRNVYFVKEVQKRKKRTMKTHIQKIVFENYILCSKFAEYRLILVILNKTSIFATNIYNAKRLLFLFLCVTVNCRTNNI